jgi:hypothetical protein
MHRSVPGRALAALALLIVLALPSFAAAQPRQAPHRRAPAERVAEAGPVVRLWRAWTHLWSQEGSGLDPDGRTLPHTSGGHGASPAGDTGSGLDPNGK